MEFRKAAIFGSCLSKDYAEDLFRLLATYQSISASEAASRLNLHIKTVQDFFEDLFSIDILAREEVSEGKRPYFRYRLNSYEIRFTLNLSDILAARKTTDSRLRTRIREKKNAGARFTTSRSNDYISSVTIWTGEGRGRSERKINLSLPQGKFLFHLPFPTASPLDISEIMEKAGVDEVCAPEILDIVNILIEYGVIEADNSFV